MQAHFRNTLLDRSAITEIAMLRRPDTGDDSSSGFDVLELHEPVIKGVCLVEGVHDRIVSIWIREPRIFILQ